MPILLIFKPLAEFVKAVSSLDEIELKKIMGRSRAHLVSENIVSSEFGNWGVWNHASGTALSTEL